MNNFFSLYTKEKKGTAAVEAALLLPLLFTMIFGVWEVGHAMTANHKMITATQVVADLVARNPTVTDSDITQAVEAAILSMTPYASSTADFGIDILSVKFDKDDKPQALWEKSYNMGTTQYSSNLSSESLAASTGLGTSGEGAMVVTMIYDFKPTFGSGVLKAFRMKERAFSRGRKSSVVTYN